MSVKNSISLILLLCFSSFHRSLKCLRWTGTALCGFPQKRLSWSTSTKYSKEGTRQQKLRDQLQRISDQLTDSNINTIRERQSMKKFFFWPSAVLQKDSPPHPPPPLPQQKKNNFSPWLAVFTLFVSLYKSKQFYEGIGLRS